MKTISIVTALTFLHVFGFIVLVNGCRATSDPSYKKLNEPNAIAGPSAGQIVAPEESQDTAPIAGQLFDDAPSSTNATTTPSNQDRISSPPPPREEPRNTNSFYVVKKNENLSIIARRNGITIADLEKANNLRRSAILRAGDKLVIPAPQKKKNLDGEKTSDGEIYIVKRGDALSKIARAKGTTVAKIQAANPKMKGTNIFIGQKLIIPTSAPQKAEPAKQNIVVPDESSDSPLPPPPEVSESASSELGTSATPTSGTIIE